MSVHLFLSDQALVDPSLTFVNLDSLNLSMGYLDRVLAEHFVNPSELIDQRSERLAITYRPETAIGLTLSILVDSLLHVLPEGSLHLAADEDETVTLAEYPDLSLSFISGETLPAGPTKLPRSNDMQVTLDYSRLSAAEKTMFANMTPYENTRLFNIIEYLTYGTISSDDVVEINTKLVTDPEFEGYLANTLQVEQNYAIINLWGPNIHRFIPAKCEFEYAMGGVAIPFVLWLDRNTFKNEYPITTITKIIPPFELSVLLNPINMLDPIEAASLGKSISDTALVPEITTQDQSGMRIFSTRYLHGGNSYVLSFSIVYRGKTPDDLESRNILVDYLLTSGTGTQALWEAKLPDLFVKSTFFIVPFYDLVHTIANTAFYPSVVNINDIIQRYTAITLNIPRKLPNSFEVMTVAWDKLFCGVCADAINQVLSISEAHPTYRDFSSTDVGFIEMSVNDKNWSSRLNQALATAAGEVNSIQISRVTVGGHVWINLVYNNNAYNIITKSSYLEGLT